jgi:hypothetical protein
MILIPFAALVLMSPLLATLARNRFEQSGSTSVRNPSNW